MRTKIFLAIGVILLLLFIAIGGKVKQPVPTAGLTPQSSERLQAWNVPQNITTSGEGNSFRVVTGKPLEANEALELAAGGTGRLEYYAEIATGPQAQGVGRFQFLSTQGTGRVWFTALDAQDKVLGVVGWVFTGDMPPAQPRAKWLDRRYNANFVGEWLSFSQSIADMFATNLPELDVKTVAKYRLYLAAGEGQHSLITSWRGDNVAARAIKFTPGVAQMALQQGDTVSISAEVENISGQAIEKVSVEAVEPYGYGLVVQGQRSQAVTNLLPGEKRQLSWQVRAQRPDAVNMSKPWRLNFSADGIKLPQEVVVAVSDPRPGKIFYVMTDDLETIDAAGYHVAWGNADGWLEPQEVTAQMVNKAEAVNKIASQYGAKWTHYIAWPVVKAAEWTAKQSTSGQWPKVAAAITQSVREQSALGHEYGVHLHSDYDPYLPGNMLSYNASVDGFWANHLRHGWSHSIAEEGDFATYASRAGFLYAYQRELDKLEEASHHGQLLTSRVGSFDFGNGSESEAMSTRVYRKVGLWGSSDADGNAGGITSGNFGQEIYFAKPDDINSAAVDITATGLVEFRPTPRDFISYDSQTAAVMDQKADMGVAQFTAQGATQPGVHAIVGFTHVMFVMGDGGWQSTTGGQFAAIDAHLRYLKERYADKGLIQFATATELVSAFLDYYSPQPVAVYGPRTSTDWAVSEYPIHILGRDIPIDADHPHTLSVKYPLYLRDSAFRISVLKNGTPIYTTWGLPTPYNDIVFTIDDAQAEYSLKIYHNESLNKAISILRAIKAKITNITKFL